MLPNTSRYDQTIVPDYIDSNRKQYKGLTYVDPAEYRYVSRYKYTRRILDQNNIEYHETYVPKPVPESSDDTYFKVDNTTVNRLDLIAYRKYGYSVYWWVIAMANNIIDPFNVPLDTILRIPPIQSLYENGSVLSDE